MTGAFWAPMPLRLPRDYDLSLARAESHPHVTKQPHGTRRDACKGGVYVLVLSTPPPNLGHPTNGCQPSSRLPSDVTRSGLGRPACFVLLTRPGSIPPRQISCTATYGHQITRPVKDLALSVRWRYHGLPRLDRGIPYALCAPFTRHSTIIANGTVMIG